MPRVSIILPTYDRLAYLKQSVASVLAQRFADWELIIVDDGSRDGTDAWLTALNDSRIVVVASEHSGNLARVRNAGVARARGEWIAFLDSDDSWAHDKLSLQLAALEEQTSRRWSCTGVEFIDHVGAPAGQRGGPVYSARSGWVLESLVSHEMAATLRTLMVAKSLLLEVGAFDEAYRVQEDFDLVLRLAARSEVLALSQTLTRVREHSGRTTGSVPAVELFRVKELVIRKALRSVRSTAERRACGRALGRETIHGAYAIAEDGNRASAIQLLASALAAAPLDPTVWRWVLGAVRRVLSSSRGLGRS